MNRYQPSTFRPAFGVAAAACRPSRLRFGVLPIGLATGCPAA